MTSGNQQHVEIHWSKVTKWHHEDLHAMLQVMDTR